MLDNPTDRPLPRTVYRRDIVARFLSQIALPKDQMDPDVREFIDYAKQNRWREHFHSLLLSLDMQAIRRKTRRRMIAALVGAAVLGIPLFFYLTYYAKVISPYALAAIVVAGTGAACLVKKLARRRLARRVASELGDGLRKRFGTGDTIEITGPRDKAP